MTPKVEIKGLEMGLSFKNPELKLMTMSLVVDGDMSQFLDDEARKHVDLKGQIRIECPLAPDLVKKAVELARAAADVNRGLEVEAQIAKTEKQLAYWSRLKSKDNVRRLEGELSKLNKIRGAVGKAKDVALQTIEKIGVSLEKSAGGRLLKKIGGKALSLVFKRFVPIYNLVSTAQDIVEIATFLKNVDWGNVGDRIANGGEGGTSFSDGSHEGTAGGGAGFGAGGEGDSSADALALELQGQANVKLHATAASVVADLESKVPSGGSAHSLSDEDKQKLNYIIPEDLDAEEIEAMKVRLGTSSSKQQDLVTTVIEAMQQIRPFGKKRLGPEPEPSKDGEGDERVAASSAKKDAARAKAKPKTASSGTWIVDPVETLQRVVKVDERGQAIVPTRVQFPGFMATVTRTGVATLAFGSGEAASRPTYMVKVDIRPVSGEGTAFVRTGSDIRPVIVGEAITNVVVIVSGTGPSS